MKRWIEIMTLTALACATVAGCAPASSEDAPPPEDVPSDEPSQTHTLMFFHNNTGPMCIEALAWLASVQAGHPNLLIEEHLTTEAAGYALLGQLKSQYGQSQGVSTSFGYLPIIFFGGQAFSGFNNEIRQSLAGLIESL